MTDSAVVSIAAQALMLGAKLAAPILIVTLLLGFFLSLFQSVTQIQDATLSFVPKLIASGLILMMTGRWMIGEMVNFTHQLADQIPKLLSQ